MDGEPTWQRLLAERQHRALRATMRARIVGAAFGLVAVTQTAGHRKELLLSGTLVLGYLLLVAALLRLLRHPRWTHAVGILGALFDSAVLGVFPIIWHVVHTSAERPMIHLLGHQITAVSFIIMIVNCAALRPLYPAIVTALATVLHSVLAYLAVTDVRLSGFPGGLSAILRPSGRGQGDLVLTGLLVAFGGGALVLLTRRAHALVGELIERELRQHQMREAQMQLVMETRISALAGLVAGVVHEVNTPLGAMDSAADTARRALEKLRQRISPDQARALGALAVFTRHHARRRCSTG